MSADEIRREVMMIAGHLAPGEAMTAEDAKCSLRTLIVRTLSDRSMTTLHASLIAICLAEHIEAPKP